MGKRFYLPDLVAHQTVWLSSDEAHHLRVVLRAREGDAITLFNGCGEEGLGRIEEIHSNKIRILLGEVYPIKRASGLSIHLGLPIVKEKAWDLALRGAVELGVASIHPLITQRSSPLPPSKWIKKQDRWQKILENSCKQCGANLFPPLFPISYLKDFSHKKGLLLFGHPEGPPMAKGLAEVQLEEATLLLGPEGGFGQEEVELLQGWGFLPLSLGPRILRVETAAIALVATLLFFADQKSIG